MKIKNFFCNNNNFIEEKNKNFEDIPLYPPFIDIPSTICDCITGATGPMGPIGPTSATGATGPAGVSGILNYADFML